MLTDTLPQQSPEVLEALEAPPPKFVEARHMPIDAITEDENDRTAYTEIEELAESIRRVGILQPLRVRFDDFTPRLVFGHRRLRAAKSLGLTEVPVEVYEMTALQALEARVVENAQRVNLNAMEEALAYQRLQKASTYTAEQIAAKTGKSKATIYARLKLLELAPELQNKLKVGSLDASLAVPLARVQPHKMQLQAHARIAEAEMTTRDAIIFLQKDFTISLKGAWFSRKDDMLIAEAGPCTTCPKRSGRDVAGIFDDIESADVCTDVPCYRRKQAAHWEGVSAKFVKADAKVLSVAEGQRLFKHGNLAYDGKYVAVDAVVPNDRERRTWDQLLDGVEKRPRLVVAPDLDGKPVKLYLESEVRQLVDGPTEAEEGEEPKKGKKAEAGESAAETAARIEAAVNICCAIAVAAKKKGPSLDLLRLVAERALDLPQLRGAMGVPEGVDAGEQWLKEKASREALVALVVGEALMANYGYPMGALSPELLKHAKAAGVDVVAIERDAMEPVKAAAEEKAAKKRAKK